MAYTFARIGAVLSLKVEDYYVQKRRGWIRLHEKGGKVNEIPCHPQSGKYLEEYLQAAGISGDAEEPALSRLAQRTAPPKTLESVERA